jgi:alkaline phosphatase D
VTTILHITDAHLSPRNTLFRRNFELVREAARAASPDLCLATGDLSLDGADRDPDLAFAAEWHRTMPGTLLAIPGNHDVGSDARLMPTQTFDAARMERWRRHLGPGRHVLDVPGWRIVALNTEAMGTGTAEEEAQRGFIAEAAAGAGDRRIALFLHRPAFQAALDEAWNPWSVPPAGRAALAPLLTHPGLRLVASGHVHLARAERRGQVDFVWAPALSFYCHERDQPGMVGSRAPGALIHRLHADHVETITLAPPGMEPVLIDDVRDQTYPPPA